MIKKTHTPPYVLMANHFYRITALILCTLFSFALTGCGNKYDYNDFLEHQKRYKQEKELVSFLREYDKIYQQNIERQDILKKYAGGKIEFIFDGTAIFTSDNFVLTTLSTNDFTVTLDVIATEILAKVTTENIGEYIDMYVRNGENSALIFHSIIHSPILNGGITISNVDNLSFEFWAIHINTQLENIAVSYNALRENCRTTANYLPALLAVPPSYLDVTPFLEKAELKGF